MSDTWHIYRHTTPNGKRYIGQTSLDPRYRWQKGRGYSTQQYFKRAIDKYGWDNIEHTVLCSVSSKEDADFLERWFIEKYNTTNRKYGYNIATGGNGPFGVEWDEERKRKHSESMTGSGNPMYGRHHTPESIALISKHRSGQKCSPELRELRISYIKKANERRQTPVNQYDLDGNLIATYSGFGEMEKATGFNHSSVICACQGKKNTAYGFKWEYVDKDKRSEADAVRDGRTSNSMPVIQRDLDGNEVACFKSMTEAQKKTGLNRNKISDACHGGRESYAGYVWEFGNVKRKERKKKPVVQLDLHGNEIARFDSVQDASGNTGVPTHCIRACCSGKTKTSFGFIWKYLNDEDRKTTLGVPTGVIQLDLEGNEICRYKSLADAMRATGHDRHRIVECCKGERESYRECTWRYVAVA